MASVRQIPRHVKSRGKAGAAWYVFWRERGGRQRSKSYGPGERGRRAANKAAREIQARLALAGDGAPKRSAPWSLLRADLDELLLPSMRVSHRKACRRALELLEHHCEPKRVTDLTAQMLDRFAARRAKDPGKKPGGVVSPATVQRDLRYLRLILRTAYDWGYLDRVPRVPAVRVPQTIKPHIDAATFNAIHAACDVAQLPRVARAGDWWRGYLSTLYLTGWRRTQVLDIKWSDVDFDAMTLRSDAEHNKGRRDVSIPLHPAIAGQMGLCEGFDRVFVFPWTVDERGLYPVFHQIQTAAGVEDRDGQPFGFHALRRGFATANASTLDLFELQRLMMHREISTTRSYVDMAEKMDTAVAKIAVPDSCLEADGF